MTITTNNYRNEFEGFLNLLGSAQKDVHDQFAILTDDFTDFTDLDSDPEMVENWNDYLAIINETVNAKPAATPEPPAPKQPKAPKEPKTPK